MRLIDREGKILGYVNVIDAAVVLLFLIAAVSGFAFVTDSTFSNTGSSTDDTGTVAIIFQVDGIEPFVADAISEGPVGRNHVISIENKSVRPTVVVIESANGELHKRKHPEKRTVMLTLKVRTTSNRYGTQFRSRLLQVGKIHKLNLGDVTVKGTITEIPSTNDD